jgi:hypothetical protein
MLEKSEAQLHVKNGSNVSATIVRNMELNLPSCFILKLNNIYFIPSIAQNIISISCLNLIIL